MGKKYKIDVSRAILELYGDIQELKNRDYRFFAKLKRNIQEWITFNIIVSFLNLMLLMYIIKQTNLL